MHQRTEFQQNWAIRGWVIDDSANFSGRLSGATLSRLLLRVARTEIHQIWKGTSHNSQSIPHLFQISHYIARFRNQSAWKVAGAEKSRPNSRLFTHVIITERMGETSESPFQARDPTSNALLVKSSCEDWEIKLKFQFERNLSAVRHLGCNWSGF